MATSKPNKAHHRTRRKQARKQKPLARLLALAVAHATPLALALLVAAALAPLALPALERKLDFEESGPLPGSARPNIRSAPGAEARFDAASRAAEALLDAHRDGGGAAAFFAGLARELEAKGLEVARLTEWRSDWPYGRRRGRRCAALHAVLRSPRGDGKESVAIVTPIALQPRPRSLAGQTRADAALALSAAHALVAGHLRDAAPWLAKDVIWIVPDASCGGAEAVGAWLAAYHQELELGTEAGGGEGAAAAAEAGRRQRRDDNRDDDQDDEAGLLLRRRPFVRAGVIQQALVLQSESLVVSPSSSSTQSTRTAPATAAVSLALVGADGQLPKTDFYWLVRYYCSKWVRLGGCAPPGFPASPPGGKPSGEDGPLLRALAAAVEAVGGGGGGSSSAAAEGARSYARRLGLVLRFAAQQARGLPTGAHAPFKWRNTDAVTIAFSGGAAQSNQKQSDKTRARQAAELLELSVRSCSVLVERLHHAFFLYALSSPDHFVSVERYIGPVCALIGVLVLQAAAARQALGGDGGDGSEDEDDDDDEGSAGHRRTAAAPASGSWAASARVAVLLPLLCGALGWSLRAGLEAASLAPPPAQGGGGAGSGSAFSLAERAVGAAAGAARRLFSTGGGGFGGLLLLLLGADPGAAAAAADSSLGPGYAAAEALRMGSIVVAVAVLAWVGLAEGEGVLLLRQRRTAGKEKRAAASSSSSSSSIDWRMLKVLMLCGAAVPLAGMACANWALAHAAALACAPLAFAAPSSGASASLAASRLRVAAVALCSPLGLAALAALGTAAVSGPGAVVAAMMVKGGGAGGCGGGGAAAAATDAARWLVLEGTSWATWSFAWCVYAPLWVASAWIVSLPARDELAMK